MTNRVERIAQAMYESNEFVKGWDHEDTVRLYHAHYRDLAEVAITAMMDPGDVDILAVHMTDEPPGPELKETPEAEPIEQVGSGDAPPTGEQWQYRAIEIGAITSDYVVIEGWFPFAVTPFPSAPGVMLHLRRRIS